MPEKTKRISFQVPEILRIRVSTSEQMTAAIPVPPYAGVTVVRILLSKHISISLLDPRDGINAWWGRDDDDVLSAEIGGGGEFRGADTLSKFEKFYLNEK